VPPNARERDVIIRVIKCGIQRVRNNAIEIFAILSP